MLASPKHFQIIRRLGEGGMGVVYEAIDLERQNRVALKTLRSFTPEGLARFKREFRALQGLHHRNLVTLGELVSEDDRWFFTMELVEGVDFLEHVRPRNSGVRFSSQDALTSDALTENGASLPHDATLPSEHLRAALPVPEEPPALESPTFDEARLRAALIELTQGLAALHDAKKVHRDIKPSNIRVGTDSRVVLLDFGLVSEVAGPRVTNDSGAAGTPAYMAPEQASSRPVGPEADWYGVGVVLYEALTGRTPFAGSALEMLIHKQSKTPPPPSGIVSGIPQDLERLCLDLLSVDPRVRPTAEDVLQRLAPPTQPESSSMTVKALAQVAPFVGRRREMAQLELAFEAMTKGHAVVALAFGESGVGKTCLVRAFTDRLGHERGEVLVLHGRCHERESVPYKALDDVVDALTRRLVRLPDEAAAALLPMWPAALTQVFPVLRRVKVFARESDARQEASDPHELRRRAFAALRELLTRIALRQRTVIVVDDLQWADADSLSLLSELLRPPQTPPLLLIATARASTDASSVPEAPEALLAAIPGDVRPLPVTRLAPSEAHELATLLMASDDPGAAARAAAIAEDAAGHPLFIDELVRHANLVGTEASGLKLDEALWARIAQLEEHARRVLELVAVAAAPLTQETVTSASRMDPGEFTRAAAALRASHLVRTGGARGTDLIEPYHDRVREAVLARLDDEARRLRHENLAFALEGAKVADAESLATHWRGAGNTPRAERFAVAAAEQAAKALAFDRAARWYQEALELHPADDAQRRVIRGRLGDALSHAGRGALAAAEYQAAADGASSVDAINMRRRAAEELLQSGHFDHGLAVTEQVLHQVGLRLPASPMSALLQLLFWRVFLWFRGMRFTARDATQVPPSELTRIDTCYALGLGLSLTDHVYGALFNTRTLLLALRAGELTRIARATGFEIAFYAARGVRSWNKTESLMRMANGLVEKLDDPRVRAFSMGVFGTAHYLNGRYKRGLDLSDRSQHLLRHQVTGSAWEVATTQLFGINSLFFLGELRELCARVPRSLREALERGDLFATVNFRIGFANSAWLVIDDADGARKQAREAMENWSKRGFHIEHFYELVARVNIELYAGDSAAADAIVAERLPSYTRSLLGRVQTVRLAVAHARGRAALAGANDPMRLRLAEKMASEIEQEGAPWADGIALLLRAAVASRRGETAIAADILRDTLMRFDSADMALFAAVTRRRLGEITGGEKGRALVVAADMWMREQGVEKPARIAAMLAPGIGEDGCG